MKNDIDWRHIAAAVLVVGLILFGGYRLLAAKPEPPRAVAPAGPNAQLQDAPEHPATSATPTVR